MTVVAFGSVKGAPGTTTVAMLVAAAWPRPAVLVEADPDGGVLGARLGWSTDPGLATLGAATRHSNDAGLDDHSRDLGRLRLVTGPRGAERARAALAAGIHLPGALAAADRDAIVDCGRLAPDSPALTLAAGAATTLCVCRPALDELQHLPARTAALEALGTSPRVVLVGERPYARHEVEEALGVKVAGVLPHDPATAAAVSAGRLADPSVQRSRLVRAAAELAEWLTHHVDPSPESDGA